MRSGLPATARGLLAAFIVAVCCGTAMASPASLQREKIAFYNDVHAKRWDDALSVGAAYQKQQPGDDRFALDYAYALLSAHRSAEAATVLERLKSSSISAVRSAARKQLLAQAPTTAAGRGTIAGVSAAAPPFTGAYELLAGGDLGAARDAFKTTLVQYPTDAPAWRQLSYIDFVLKDRTDMIGALDHYIVLRPDDDRAKLERAYALLADKQDAPAHAALVSLATSPNSEVAEAARRQLAVVRANALTGSAYPREDVFGYALNDSRFHDTFYGVDARYRLAPTRVEPYLAVHLTNDSKSSAVPANQVLNDNVAIVSVGARTAIARNVYAYAESGEAKSLLTGHTQSDLRYGFLASTRTGAGGDHPQNQIDASVTHYSRYVNTIAYGTLVHDFYVGSKVVRGLVGSNIALDTSRAFYNNAAEGFVGVQVRKGPLTLRVIATGGTYLGRGIDLPKQRTYSSIRPELLFGFSH